MAENADNGRCLWCGSPRTAVFRNPHKGWRRMAGAIIHAVLLVGVLVLLFHLERRLEAACLFFASCVLLYEFIQGPFFNDFRVCQECARIEILSERKKK